jgi:choline dehydrogenase-like flavoprotein
MGDDASSGVVNPNGEVWDCHGLFVVGTAVLPTSGFANPTLTAVALAFRLAEYLVLRRGCSLKDGAIPLKDVKNDIGCRTTSVRQHRLL